LARRVEAVHRDHPEVPKGLADHLEATRLEQFHGLVVKTVGDRLELLVTAANELDRHIGIRTDHGFETIQRLAVLQFADEIDHEAGNDHALDRRQDFRVFDLDELCRLRLDVAGKIEIGCSNRPKAQAKGSGDEQLRDGWFHVVHLVRVEKSVILAIRSLIHRQCRTVAR